MHLLLLFTFLLIGSASLAQPFVPGQTYFSADGYIEYRCGNLPLILTAPHGGYLEPATLPDRSCPDAVTIRDGFTQELGRVIDSVFNEYHGCSPHLIINHLHRKKLDPNREQGIATCDSPQAVAAWEAFHRFTDSAKALVTRDFGKGLLLDLHGHAHTIQRLELGYQLTGDHLRSGDSAINSAFRVQRSGIRSLVAINRNGLNHVELLRGENALGTWLQRAGYASVPSQQIPFPLAGEPFFSGAYITERHGSMPGGSIDAIQMEHQMTGVRETAATRRVYADTLRRVIIDYLQLHSFGDTGFLNCQPVSSGIQKQNSHQLFSLYPNPSALLPQIEVQTAGELKVYDFQGRCLFSGMLESGIQSLPFLPKSGGIYLISMTTSSGYGFYTRWVYYP